MTSASLRKYINPNQVLNIGSMIRDPREGISRTALSGWPAFKKMTITKNHLNNSSLEYKFQHLFPLPPFEDRYNRRIIQKYVSEPSYQKLGARCAWMDLIGNTDISYRDLFDFHKRFLILHIYLSDVFPVATSRLLLKHDSSKGVIFHTLPRNSADPLRPDFFHYPEQRYFNVRFKNPEGRKVDQCFK
ncbi:unnamed protein product [Mucor hiemalis]